MVVAGKGVCAKTSSKINTLGYSQRELFCLLFDHVNELMESNGRYFNVVEYKENQSKSKKYLEGMDQYINAGKVAYLESCSNIDLLKDEMRNFFGNKSHDDTLDGMFLSLLNVDNPPALSMERILELIEKGRSNKSNNRISNNNWKVA